MHQADLFAVLLYIKHPPFTVVPVFDLHIVMSLGHRLIRWKILLSEIHLLKSEIEIPKSDIKNTTQN